MSGILLFGGSFNPIHNGHLIAARAAAEMLDVQRVVLIPAALPPHKRGVVLAPADARLEMCRLASAAEPRFEASDWEIRQPGPSYTLLTVEHFREAFSGSEIFWLLGSDSLGELGAWHRAGELVDRCTIVTAGRPGFRSSDWRAALSSQFTAAQLAKLEQHILDTPLIDISATDIRARVRRGASIRYLVPDAVADYIARSGLYR